MLLGSAPTSSEEPPSDTYPACVCEAQFLSPKRAGRRGDILARHCTIVHVSVYLLPADHCHTISLTTSEPAQRPDSDILHTDAYHDQLIRIPKIEQLSSLHSRTALAGPCPAFDGLGYASLGVKINLHSPDAGISVAQSLGSIDCTVVSGAGRR